MGLVFDKQDSFYTLSGVSTAEYKEKGSKFLAFAYPVENKIEVKSFLEVLKKEYYDARHHCYAYMLGYSKDIFRANDDGEPSSTAGKPILGQIISADISNVLIVVVRYFGGKKLGVSGLISAYKTAASMVIESANIISYTLQTKLSVSCNFDEIEKVMKLVKSHELALLNQEYTTEKVQITLSVRNKLLEQIIDRLKFATVERLG